MKGWPITVKLTIILLMVSLIPMTFIAYYTMQESLKSISASEQNNLRLVAASIAGRLDQLIKDNHQIINFIATDHDVIAFLVTTGSKRREYHQKATGTLLRVKAASPDIASAYLMSADGIMAAATYPEIVGKDISFRSYYINGIRGESYVSDILIGSVSGESGVYFSGPVRGKDGKIIGVAVIKMNAQAVYTILGQVNLSKTPVRAFLVDRNGIIISHPDPALLFHSLTPLSQNAIDEIQRHSRFPVKTIESLDRPDVAGAMLKNTSPGYMEYRFPGSNAPHVLGYARMALHSWTVGITEPEAFFARPLNILFYKCLGSVALAGILITLLAVVLGRAMVRPIRSLTGATRILSGSKEDGSLLNDTVKSELTRISATRGDEIGQLAGTFNEMIESLQEYIADLKNATAANERMTSKLEMAEAIQTSLKNVIGELLEDRQSDYSFDWLTQHMEAASYKRGEYLFHKGDKADKMFYINKGAVRLVELNHVVGKGNLIGEMGIITPAKERTVSVMCEEDAELYGLEEEKAKTLFYQDPSIIFHLVHISIVRSLENLAATVAEKERIEADLRIARDIQASVLPRSFPAFPDRKDFDIFALMEPAREVGGDFYDFFLINENRLCFIIGDVSGKGIPAALFMMVTQILLKTLALSDLSPDEVLFRANNMISSENEQGMFVTILCAMLNTETGEVEIANAGHNPPLIHRGSGAGFEFIALPESIVLGPIEGARFSSLKVALKPGDVIFFYTDGVTEAMNPRSEFFSEERLKTTLSSLQDRQIVDLVSGVRDAVRNFAQGAPQSDDITMLALQYKGATAGR
jgi:serine phosphatase RsbU (regulator of sigma subunit)/C4-dicarboxylate-specific signal transduction histidine kinase